MRAGSLAGEPGGAVHSALARWAVGLAAGVAGLVAVSYAVFGAMYAIGGWDAIEDTWVGYLGVWSLLGGMVVSLVAFVLAIVAVVKHEQWTLLRLPLAVFPVLFAIVMIGEAVFE